MQRLIYEKYNNSNDILVFDLHNGYSVIALSGWNHKKQNYSTTLFLKDNTVDDWKLIEEAEFIEFNANYKTIKKEIADKITFLHNNHFFNYYIERCKYELDCFDRGNELNITEGDK